MQAVLVKNLSFAYPGRETVLHDISFSVNAGEIFVVAGPSGCGKTTLCRLICGIIPHAVKGKIEGEISVMGIDPFKTALPQIALQAGLVFQDADSQIICGTVEDELAFALENLCWPPPKIRHRVEELLEEFELAKLRDLDPARLSGGKKKLLTIAAVTAPAPPLLLLDEPMSGLDNESRVMVRAAIEQQRLKGRTVIWVEHDLKLASFADRWFLLNKGAAVLCDTPERIIKQKNLLEELHLLP